MIKGGKKTTIRFALTLISLIGMLACAVSAAVFHSQNPDMTEIERYLEFPSQNPDMKEIELYLEFPWPKIGAAVCLVVHAIGKYVIKD